ncbi:hypothetical protein [Methylobacter sp. YRD-M1]|uniref:hypothetical protein n=1 Tax=Methylobacter sp. YRD-M1 TaxID=2911520 RepID=UPI00227BE7F9|nr:hypothetical protein [Methylobacter sp. YRD-M1]WAK03896.1 hypothetical protein LZ558_08955 [Methylobacter sp. YRD-M1]
MRKYLLTLSFFALAAYAFAADIAVAAEEALPEPVMAQIQKRHPNAADIKAEQKTHFGQAVYEVHFKDGENEQIELYRKDGHFYVSGEKIDASSLMPDPVNDNLKSIFSKYEIKEAILIVNPNGPGEEYDLSVVSDNQTWNVTVDNKGNIIKKEREE